MKVMAEKATKKAPAKKAAPKKAAPRKAAPKKAAAKKTPAKKAAPKKAAPKKAVAKAPAKKAAPKKAAAKAPAKKKPKTPFGKKFLDEQKAALITERARYVLSADNLQAEADALLEDRDPGDVQFDDESGEGDTLAVERDLDLALSAQARESVDEIDAALERIRKGVYGVCVKSGKNIPRERLEVIPWASERVEFKAGGLGRR